LAEKNKNKDKSV